MDADRFDCLARALFGTATRRALFGLGAASLLGVLGPVGGKAKKKRHKGKHKKKCKKCGPCAKCKKGKCKPKAAGTACGDGKQCFPNGKCVACDVCASGCDHTTLQEAVDAASNGATIQICPGTYASSYLLIGKDLTVIGAGTGKGGTVLDGQEIDDVVTVVSARVVLRGLALRRGAGGNGGGMDAFDSVVTLENVHVTDNQASDYGGGVHVYNGALTLIGSRVSGNVARDGGGIYSVDAAVTLTDESIVTGNTATEAGAAGGIANFGGNGTVLVTDGSQVTGNTPVNCTGTPAC